MNDKTMDSNETNVGNGLASLCVSFITGIIAWIGKYDLSDFIKNISIVISMGAGILAGIYWYFAIKDKRMDIKRKQKENK